MIGEKTIQGAAKLVTGMLTDYTRELDLAFLKGEDGVDVAISLKFKPRGSTSVDIKAAISFVTEKIKDTGSATITEGQETLFSVKPRLPQERGMKFSMPKQWDIIRHAA